ncbi:unnamed protein product [Didymodactylos carnosus]|uniref:Uncharacterized protein n=1 Tax=Didymodactylos carnosus TaxID=1234261 RepID=A0A813TCS8_9BILA|nr:unnamed protein product [Didymodactylos carnosus]CAF3596427.1 unnamed protein product [Didymodactylos carnosus]
MTGTLDGWWHFTNTGRRSNYPLLPKQAWENVIKESGFDECIIVDDSVLPIIIAQVPSNNHTTDVLPIDDSEKSNWLIFHDTEDAGKMLSSKLQSVGDNVVCEDSSTLNQDVELRVTE